MPSATSPAPTMTSIAVVTLDTIVMAKSSARRCPVESASAPSHGLSTPATSSGSPRAIDHNRSVLPRPAATYEAKYTGYATPEMINV